MPASVYEPISSVLKNSFHGAGGFKNSSLENKIDSSLQKSMLVSVHFDDPVKQCPTLTPKQKSKYTILNKKSDSSVGENNDQIKTRITNKLDQVPEPKMTLFRRDQVELGYRSPTGPGAGMFNMGNTCYLNSTLQALFHTPAFVNYLRFGGHESSCSSNGFSSCTICLMAVTLRGTTNANTMKPIKIYEKLKLICKHLTHGRQEDAHEFLRYLVESMQKSYLISRKIPKTVDNYTKETTPLNQIFGGYMRQDVVCMRCKYVSTTFQHFMDLLLDIRQADNIDAALGGYFKRENLGQGENMYKCEKCKQKVPATKQYKIERPPMVLCIQLKRFNLMGGKNGRPVTLTRKLDLSNHVRWARNQNVPIEYRLVSMINHVGPSPNCGHYTSIGEAGNGTFYRFDDATVHPTSLQNALHTSAYVIFYEMLKSSRNLLLNSTVEKESTKAANGPTQLNSTKPCTSDNKLIGPQLPPQIKSASSQPVPNISSSKPTTISPSPKLIQDPIKIKTPTSMQIKPKIIVEPSGSKVNGQLVKKVSKPENICSGLVPYDGGSSSDEEVESNKNKKQSPKEMPILSKAASLIPSSPFLPRSVVVNFKKNKNENSSNSVIPDKKNEEISSGTNKTSLKTEPSITAEEPNRDPCSEALFSKTKENGTLEVESSKSTIIKSSKNEFTVSDLEAHNPSIHSDNSTGSTASFSVTDIGASKPITAGSSSDVSVTSRQKWSVTSIGKTDLVSNKDSKLNGVKTDSKYILSSSKRERSVPPTLSKTEKVPEELVASDTELMGSPKKRKKISMFEKGNLLEKAAEIGKDVWNAGTKLGMNLFKSNKLAPKSTCENSVEIETDSITSCEATTSYQDEKPKSSVAMKIETTLEADDENDEDFHRSKKHKKKKKKHKKKHEETSDNEWEEKTKDNLSKFGSSYGKEDDALSNRPIKESTSNPQAPIKKWNSKPELKTIGRSVTWDGSKGSNFVEELMKGSEIRSWSGDRSTLERKLASEPRKRSAVEDLDAEMDAGRVKKVKKQKDEPNAYKWADKNPFQIAQNISNRGDKGHNNYDKRRSDDYKRNDYWSRDKSRHNDQKYRHRDKNHMYRTSSHSKERYENDRHSQYGSRDRYKMNHSHISRR